MTTEGLISMQAMTARIACRCLHDMSRLAGSGLQDRPDLMRAS